jgi:hypothetical protein
MSKKISKDAPALNVPKEIRELAQEFCRQRVKKEQAERREKQRRDAEKKRVRAARLKNGLKYAAKVFLWAQALKESAIGQELMKKSHFPTAYSTILFFDGHIIGVEWVGLGISSEGLFLTRGGRWAYFSRQQMSSPEDLAVSVPTVTIEAASEGIDNGEVWDCIKRRFDYLKEK